MTLHNLRKIQEDEEKKRKKNFCGTKQAAHEGRERKKSTTSLESIDKREKHVSEVGSM